MRTEYAATDRAINNLPADEVAALNERLRALEETNRTLEQEVVQHRLAAELARGQSEMLIESLNFLASESDLDKFLGHVLKVTVQQLQGVGGTLWFPDTITGAIRLHLEYVDSRIVPAAQSHHPAVLNPLPIGGQPVSTFPTDHAETYVLGDEVSGMPEENRAYINSLGVRTLLTVPMTLGKETVGWICVRSSKSDSTDLENKIYLADALAGQATLAVQLARLGEQARQAGVLEERNRIAREIHDTLAQGFTGVVLNLEAATRTLRKGNIELTLEHMEHARGLAQVGLEEARLSVGALRPEALHKTDLTHALQELLRRLESGGALDARFTISGEKFALPTQVESELLRIAQEGMINVLKHAKAKQLELKLTFGADTVSLSIADDGAGFDPCEHHDGFGLLGMRERAERIGAELRVTSRSPSGTRVETILPKNVLNHG